MDQIASGIENWEYWQEKLLRNFAYIPFVAFEREFYIFPAPQDSGFICESLRVKAREVGLRFSHISPEKGAGQYEYALNYGSCSEALKQDDQMLACIEKYVASQGLHLSFAALPFHNQPASGLHIHIHLEKPDGERVFYKKDAEMNMPLAHCIAGLLKRIKEDLPFFAPSPASNARFVPDSGAPLTVSWGANNRTCAIRLPDSLPEHKHIEHRVSGADAKAQEALACIFSALHTGLKEKLMPPAQIFGNANDAQYGLEKIFEI